MMKLVKLLLSLTILLVVIVAIVFTAAIVFFDPNQHKDLIVEHIEDTTGRDFALDGNISMSIYPWLGIEAEGITLGNASGFGDAPFLHADKVALRIKTIPLLNKKYELDTLHLQGLVINLARDKNGISNWADLTGEQVAEQEPKQRREPFQLAAVILGGVDIKNARISWNDQQTGQHVVISDLNAATGELTYGAPINLSVDMNAQVNKPALNSKIKLDGVMNYNLDTDIYAFNPVNLLANISGKAVPGGKTDLVIKAAMETNLDSETFSITGLNMDVLGTSIKGDLTADNIKSGKPGSKAQLSIKSDDLAKLFQLVDPDVAGEIATLADRSANIKLNLESNLQQDLVRISDMDIRALGAVIQGQLEANNLQSGKPAARGRLKATGPDLPAVMQVAGQFEGGKDPKLKELGKKLAQVKDKSFDVSAEFDSDLHQGSIQVPDFSVSTLGIDAKGKLDAKQINSNDPKVDGRFSLKGEKLSGLLNALDKKELASVLQIITVDTNISSAGGDIALSPLQVNATFAGKQIPGSPADVTLKADTRINIDKQTLKMNNMTLKGLGLDVSGDINASRINSGTPAINSNLNANGRDLALVFKLAGVEPLASQLASISDRSFSIKTKMDADMAQGQVKISDLDANLVGATIKGNIDARNIHSEKLAAKGSLNATGPDLPTLMQVIGKLGGSESGLASLGKKLTNAPNKAFTISTQFDADLNKGDISLPALNIQTLGLDIKGKLTTRGLDKKKGSVDGNLSLKGEKMGAVLDALGQGGLSEVMQSLNIDAALKGNQDNIVLSPFTAKAVFAGKQIPNSPVAITLDTQSAGASLNNQTVSIKQLSLKGLGLNLAANINAAQIFSDPKLSGDLAIAEFNLRDFAKKLNQPLPVTADPGVFQKVGMKTTFSGSTKDLNLNDLSVKLDNSQLNGNFSVKHFTQPQIKFDIGIDSINADRYLAPEQQARPQQAKQPANKPSNVQPQPAASDYPVETLRTLNMDGNLFVGDFVYNNVRLQKIKFGIRAREGDINLDPIAADLYQGKYQGKVNLNAKGKVPVLNSSAILQGVQIEPLMKDFTREKESQLVGTANISGQVTAAGNNSDQMKRALNGKADLRVDNGILRGIDVRKTLETAEIIIEDKRIDLIGSVKQGGETPFERLTASLPISNGVMTNSDLLMLSPGIRVTGHGTVANLHNNTIKYTLKAAVDKTTATRGEHNYNLGGYTVPVRCEGSFYNLSSACNPDLSELAKVAVQKTLIDKLGDKLGVEIPDGAGQTQPPPSGSTTTQQESTTKDPGDQIKKDIESIKDLFDKF